MAGMSKNEKFQLELLRKLIAGKPCYSMTLKTTAQIFTNIYGWGEVFRVIDPRGMFVTDADANCWNPLEIVREANCMVAARCPNEDFDVKVGRGKKTIACFNGGEGFGKVYIDMKNLDYFEDGCIFLMKTPYDMVLVWKDGKLVGGVMPFVAKK